MSKNEIRRLFFLYLPYVILGMIATNVGEAWRMVEGTNPSQKLASLMIAFGVAFENPIPSFHPFDLLIGICCGGGIREAVSYRPGHRRRLAHIRRHP